MLLSAGARLGPSGVQSALGAGMGEIYTARNVRLEQTVAIGGRGPDAGSGDEPHNPS